MKKIFKNKILLRATVFVSLLFFIFLTTLATGVYLNETSIISTIEASNGAGDVIGDDYGDIRGGLVPCTLKECTFCHLLLMVNNIIQWLLGIAFVVGVLFIILNGFLYILSIGDEGMMTGAKQGLWMSVIGFAICLLAWLFIHVTYLIIGYKGDSWYKIECNVESSSSSSSSDESLAYLPNEVDPGSLGGRANPVSLYELSSEKLVQLPTDEYFFVNGIGGQPLELAAQRLARVAKTAIENNKEIYLVIPKENMYGEVEKTNTIKLNDYLDQSSDILSQKNQDVFKDLALSLLLNNVSELSTFAITDSGNAPPRFSGVWPTYDWTDESKKVEPFTTTDKNGLVYTEGDGPLLFNTEKYDLSPNQTHIEINLNKDGSLNTKDPLKIVQVGEGVTQEQINALLQEILTIIINTDEQLVAEGERDEFILKLIKLLAMNYLNDLKEKAEKETKEEIPEDVEEETIEEEVPKEDEPTGGTGVLPNTIKNTSNKPPTSSSSNSSSSSSGSSSRPPNTGSSSSSGNNDSNISVGTNGYKLNEKEKAELKKDIEAMLKDMKLDVDPEFVMCILSIESGFKTGLAGDNGCSLGIAQINRCAGTQVDAMKAVQRYGKETYDNLVRKYGSNVDLFKSQRHKRNPVLEKLLLQEKYLGVALAVGYLKKNHVEHNRGRGLEGASGKQLCNALCDLAYSYNCGPGGCKGCPGANNHGNPYGRRVANCTMTMLGKGKCF